MRERVMVIGAAGQLGTAVTREFLQSGAQVMAMTRQDLDVTDHQQVARLSARRPHLIINCTAYNDVDEAERDPALAMTVNRDAVRALAQMADSAGATFVHYSTDFVFDGESLHPYVEEDRVRPINQYGHSKAAGEYWAAQVKSHYIIRVASLFGGAPGQGLGGRTSIDKIIDRTLLGQEVCGFSDRTVTPSYTHDVASATRRLVASHAAAGVYHCVSSEWTTWADLAHEIAAQLGVPPFVRSVSMHEVLMLAPRPLRCALSNAKLATHAIIMPHWSNALARHLTTRRSAAA